MCHADGLAIVFTQLRQAVGQRQEVVDHQRPVQAEGAAERVAVDVPGCIGQLSAVL